MTPSPDSKIMQGVMALPPLSPRNSAENADSSDAERSAREIQMAGDIHTIRNVALVWAWLMGLGLLAIVMYWLLR